MTEGETIYSLHERWLQRIEHRLNMKRALDTDDEEFLNDVYWACQTARDGLKAEAVLEEIDDLPAGETTLAVAQIVREWRRSGR